MVVITAKLRAAENCEDEVAEALSSMVNWVTENEADTLTYTLNQSASGPRDFLVFERYTNQAALDSHIGSDRMKQLNGELGGKVEGAPSVEFYGEIAAKL